MKKTLVTRLLAILVCVATLATVTPIFAAAATTITEIKITNADIVPVEGECPADHVGYTLPSGIHFTAVKCTWYDVTNECWYESKALKFKKGDTYQLVWWFEAEDGYEFAENATATINGSADNVEEALYRVSNDPTTFMVTANPVTVGEAPAATVIDKIEITNADVTPYIGEKAGDWLDYTLPENCHFTMAQHYWYNETVGGSMKADEVFAAGSKYDLCWRCEAESGYTFDAGTTVTINGSTTLLDDSYTKVHGDDPTVFVVWTKADKAVEKPAATVIDKIEITNADVTPYIGEKAGDWLDYTLPENCHFTVAKHYWYNETVVSDMKADEVFAAGSKYDICWRCEAESGYTFDAGTTVTINGSTTLLDYSFTEVSGDDPTVFFVWTKPTEPVENTVINKIKITNADVTPYIGEKAGDWLDYTLPENCHFTMQDHYWYNETVGRSMTSEDVFAAGLEYDRCWVFKAESGYTFDAGTTVTINGETDIVDTGWTVIDDEDNTIFYVWTKPTEAVEKPAANVIDKIEITDVDVLPIIGEKTNDHIDYTFSENCHFTAAEHGWYDKTDYKWVDGADDTFVAGHTYEVGWWLDADEGYTFAEDPTITINGEENIDWEYTYIDEEDSMRFYVWTKPTEAVELTVIDKIEINDADVTPYIGGKAENYLYYTLPDNCHYSMETNLWYSEDTGNYLPGAETAFASGNTYTHVWNLVAEEGYIFAENATVTVNESSALVDTTWTKRSDDGTMFEVWTLPSLATAPTVIDKIEIDGFCDAVVGGKAGDYNHITLPEDAPYQFVPNFPLWSNDTDKVLLDNSDTFETGKSYSLGGWLAANKGYIFAEDAEVRLNGGEYPVDETNTERDESLNYGGYVFYVWSEPKEAVEPIVIDKIAINDVDLEPVAGEKAGDHLGFALPDDCHYTVSNVRWYSHPIESDEEFSGMNDEDVFETETLYYVEYRLLPDEGYVFAKDATVTINGSTERTGAAFLSGDGSFSIFTKQTECVEPTEKLLGDANDDGAVNMKDVLTLRKYLAGMEMAYNAANSDVNEDGDVNMKDVLMLRKFLAGLITELGA